MSLKWENISYIGRVNLPQILTYKVNVNQDIPKIIPQKFIFKDYVKDLTYTIIQTTILNLRRIIPNTGEGLS